MRRAFRTVGLLLACSALACGGGKKIPPYFYEDAEEDAYVEVIDGSLGDAEAEASDLAADWLDADVRDARDVRDVPKDLPDTPPEDPGEEAFDAPEDGPGTGEEARDDGPDDALAEDAPADDLDAEVADLDVQGIYCVTTPNCYGKLTLGACETVSCIDNLCVAVDKPDTTRCDDGTACTTDDRCQAGECVGQPLDCSDGKVCTSDRCDPAAGCVHENLSGACDDDSECTRDDLCMDGWCVGMALDCSDSDPCTGDGCDPASGCTHLPLSIGLCDDGRGCTAGDHCSAGTCVGTSTCDDGNPCTGDACDPSGSCSYTPIAGGCDDGNACTTGDTCADGACRGTPATCDDGNPCTEDLCIADIGCSNPPRTGACDDGDACTTGDTCRDRRCVGEAIPCTDPPPAECRPDGVTVVRFEAVGTCSAGLCTYPSGEHVCAMGCLQGACVGDPCEGVDCSVPPGPCRGPGTCSQGSCTYPPADGNGCDDGNTCTLGDYCAGGACQAGPARECDDGNPCTADRCDPATGCVHAAIGGPCDDGDPCTVGDACLGQVCLSGTPRTCDDGNPCTEDSCTTGVGCVATFLQDGTTCDDGNHCTTEDACSGGACLGTGLSCNDGNPCTDDRCDDTSVGCYSVPNTAPCDDGNPCTTGDRCAGGSCAAGGPASCDDLDPCTDDACDTEEGCVHAPRSGVACDDRDPCTVDDLCTDGTCGGQPACDDGNPCTDDACDPSGTCMFTARAGTCDDGNECTVDDACDDGKCVGAQRACDDGNPCTDDACVRGTGCAAVAAASRPCDDGDACTQDDTCEAGRCRGLPVSCMTPPPTTCDVEEGVVTAWAVPGSCTGGQCTYDRIEYVCHYGCSGTTCLDEDPCLLVDCSVAPAPCLRSPGTCSGGTCYFAYDNGAACDDGNPCTTDDTCWNGGCVGGDAPDCDDGNPCTTDSCEAGTGCAHAPAAGRCDDGSACTVGDTCQDGACAPGTAADCGDGNPCTQDLCDPATGCSNPVVGDGIGCDDGNSCTASDHCVSGRCVGTGLDCNDGNPCTDDRCDDPQVGCYHVDNTLPCSDGSLCTTGDTCAGGTCVPGAPADCDDGNFCTDDSCVPATGCKHAFSTRQCADAFCGDLTFYPARNCLLGQCAPAAPTRCDDGIACTADSCSIAGCRNVPDDAACPDDGDPCTSEGCSPVLGCLSVFDFNPCDDDDACTFQDTCLAGGGCAGTPYRCDDSLDCTADECDGTGGCLHPVVPGTCRIEGACRVDGDLDPANPCRACDSAADPYGWSPNDGGACDDGLACTTGDTCLGGTCAGAPLACDDGNPCTADDCVEGQGCTFTNNTAACDDGNPCTQGDSCTEGSCTPGMPATCDDGNPCTSTECLPATGCTYALVDGSCEDGSACTVGDTCIQGACWPGVSRNCDDGNPCTLDGCDPATGCTREAAAPGTACDDGNGCTAGDQCTDGQCRGTGPDCIDGNPCTDDRCDDVATGCYWVPNTLPCDDGSVCTTIDRCSDGACVGGDEIPCDDGNPCTSDTCDPDTGCSHANTALPCDDGNACTDGDTCWMGRCLGQSNVTCDDGNECTADRCDPVAGCQYLPLTQPCDDHDPCTTSDLCTDGVCAGTPYVCNDMKDCTVETCNGLGGCSSTLLPDWCIIDGICRARGTANPMDPCRVCDPDADPNHWSANEGGACNDAKDCTYDDTCVNGVCTGTTYGCGDGLGCTKDTCDGLGGCTHAALDGWCVIDQACWPVGSTNPANPCLKCSAGTPLAWSFNDGVSCTDGNPCTLLDTCSGGTCVGGADKVCDDSNACTDDACVPASGGCVYTANEDVCVPAECNGLQYQAELRCSNRSCPARNPVSCDDGDPCTTDTCDPATGCHHQQNTAACDDHNPCTYGDACLAGQCQGTPYSCTATECLSRSTCDGYGGCQQVAYPDGSACSTDDNACTNDICQSGACRHPPKVDGTSCDDGDACTRADTCQAGTCTGANPVNCAATDSCHLDGTCDPATGLCTIPSKADGASCDDGNLCTRLDQCVSGTCVGSDPVVCQPVDDCHLSGACYPLTGACSTPIKTDGAACDDDNPCTRTDNCRSGTCTGGDPVVCLAQDACHVAGTCLPSTGTCTNPAAVDGTACDDRDPCTRADTCLSGSCTGADPVVCTGIDACHDAGTCDSQTGTCTTPAKAEGAPCDDGSLCTRDDACLSGTCLGTSYSCNDFLLCTTDRCDGAGGCSNTPEAGWCVVDGTCRSAGTPQPGNACRWCDPDSDPAGWTDRDGAGCDDLDPCTKNDTCSGGSCLGTTYDCDDHRACTLDACDGSGGCSNLLLSGFCLIDGACHADGEADPASPCQRCRTASSSTAWTALGDGEQCDDGNPCTMQDGCSQGTCSGIGYSCNDDLACTGDTCLGNGSCDHAALPGWCWVRNQCFADGTPDPLDSCRTCDASRSQTDLSAVADGTPCDDGNACTSGDLCSSGRCTGLGTDCDDGRICTADSCDAEEVCVHPLLAGWCLIDGDCVPDGQVDAANPCRWCRADLATDAWSGRSGALCDDGDACTNGDLCVDTACTPGVLKSCNDSLDCTSDSCAGGSCIHSVATGWCAIDGTCQAQGAHPAGSPCLACIPGSATDRWTAVDGIPCSDGDACTRDDACNQGQCEGTRYSCGDGLACTDDACDGLGGCTHPLQAGWCGIDGSCVAAGQQDPGNPCQGCAPGTSTTGWSPLDGLACDDLQPCTTGDTCSGGTCTGTPIACGDSLDCTTDTCDYAGQCQHAIQAGWCVIDGACVAAGALQPGQECMSCQPEANPRDWTPATGLACDDGQECTAMDLCLDGACTGVAYSCDDGKACTDDQCTGTGGCQHAVQADTCLIEDTCWAGGVTDPANPCLDCDPTVSSMAWTPRSGRACDDGQACTKEDACVAGTCTGTGFDCSDALACTLDACDGQGGCSNPLAEGWCLIDEACHAAGEAHPTEACMACSPATDRYGWTRLISTTPEVCNGVDDNCDGFTDPAGSPGCTDYYRDEDGDGSGVAGDSMCLCAKEAPYSATAGGDCNDHDDAMQPGRVEICDTKDNDCDGTIDPENSFGCSLYLYDFDGDGHGPGGATRCLCGPDGYYQAVDGGDCDDTDDTVYAGAVEACNGKDDNCDGSTDPQDSVGCALYYVDADGDGYGTDGLCRCVPDASHAILVGGDCNDSSTAIRPGAAEACNLQDDDCDEAIDEGNVALMCPIDPALAPHGTVACVAGACTWACDARVPSTSTPAWHDLDRDPANGCECQGDATEHLEADTCLGALDLGSIPDDGTRIEREGNLSVQGAEDWYTFLAVDTNWNAEANDCDGFNVRVFLSTNPGGQFLLDVYRGDCAPDSLLCTENSDAEWGVNFGQTDRGECPCVAETPACDAPPASLQDCLAQWGTMDRCGECPGQAQPGKHLCTDNTRRFTVRVRRAPASPDSCDHYRLDISNGAFTWDG